MPSVITLDNEEAQIKVAQEVPFLTGSFTNTGSPGNTVNPFQTIQRQEVGNILKITPQITDENTILLKIEQEASSLAASSAGAVDLITNKRTITTRVLVDDGGMLVLGGLIEDRLTEKESAGSGSRPYSVARQSVPRPQHQEDQVQPDGLHPAARAAHGGAGRDRNQREIQLPAESAARAEQWQGQVDAGRDPGPCCLPLIGPTAPPTAPAPPSQDVAVEPDGPSE